MIDVTQYKDAPSVRKAIKGLTSKVARLNMALKKAKGTDKEAKRQELYNEAVADREALKAKLKEFHEEVVKSGTEDEGAEGKPAEG